METDKPDAKGNFLLGNACIMLAIIFWGVNIPATKGLIPQWMSPEGVSAVRLIGGCLLFWLTSLFVKCEKIQKKDWLNIVLGGSVGLFLFIWLFIISLKFSSAIDISIIMTMPSVFVILIGVIFQHRRPSLLEYAGVALSFAGAVIVILGGGGSDGGSDALLGNLLAVISCICYAFYLVIMERPSLSYKPVSLLRWVFLFSAIPALFLLPGFLEMPILHSAQFTPWAEILFILFCPTFIAYFLVQPAIRNIGAELVSIYQYLIPVVAAIASELMGIETIRFSQIVAMAVIIGGMVLTNIGKKKRLGGK